MGRAADDDLRAMIVECESDRKVTKKTTSAQMVQKTVKEMERLMMVGDLVWCQQVLTHFNQRPACVEIRKSAPVLFSRERKATKEEEVYEMIVTQLRDFVTLITERKGKRTRDDQNAIDCVLSALIHPLW